MSRLMLGVIEGIIDVYADSWEGEKERVLELVRKMGLIDQVLGRRPATAGEMVPARQQECAIMSLLGRASPDQTSIRFGMNADPHLMGRKTPHHEANFQEFVDQTKKFDPNFAIDLGDFGCQIASGQTTKEMHDGQLEALQHHVGIFGQLQCPRYHVMGNHDVGWLQGGDERIGPEDLIGQDHFGEDITKQEFINATGIPNRYYAFDVRGFHFIVLDGNNRPDASAAVRGRDGVTGIYWIDDEQREWLTEDLIKNQQRPKIVFCHEELHHTPSEGSGEGGDAPFAPVGKQHSYVDNGWEIRSLFTNDGHVVACFFGHNHRNRWTMYAGTHYITLAATHWERSFAMVTISDRLNIRGFGGQRSYDLALPDWATRGLSTPG